MPAEVWKRKAGERNKMTQKARQLRNFGNALNFERNKLNGSAFTIFIDNCEGG